MPEKLSVDSKHCVQCFSSSLFTCLIIGNNVFCVDQMLEKAASRGLACQLEFPAALYMSTYGFNPCSVKVSSPKVPLPQ